MSVNLIHAVLRLKVINKKKTIKYKMNIDKKLQNRNDNYECKTHRLGLKQVPSSYDTQQQKLISTTMKLNA